MIRDRSRSGCVVLSLIAGGSLSSAGQSVGTAFTYQGQLKQGGVPIDGPHDFVFRLIDDSSVQVGGDYERVR
jgi:hypothetical protein